MKTEFIIQTRCFPVRIRDQRTGKELNDTIVFELNQLRAAAGMGLDHEAVVRDKYNKMGYWVLEIGKSKKSTMTVNLEELYRFHTMALGGKREITKK